jgi:hypothetical protein
MPMEWHLGGQQEGWYDGCSKKWTRILQHLPTRHERPRCELKQRDKRKNKLKHVIRRWREARFVLTRCSRTPVHRFSDRDSTPYFVVVVRLTLLMKCMPNHLKLNPSRLPQKLVATNSVVVSNKAVSKISPKTTYLAYDEPTFRPDANKAEGRKRTVTWTEMCSTFKPRRASSGS